MIGFIVIATLAVISVAVTVVVISKDIRKENAKILAEVNAEYKELCERGA